MGRECTKKRWTNFTWSIRNVIYTGHHFLYFNKYTPTKKPLMFQMMFLEIHILCHTHIFSAESFTFTCPVVKHLPTAHIKLQFYMLFRMDTKLQLSLWRKITSWCHSRTVLRRVCGPKRYPTTFAWREYSIWNMIFMFCSFHLQQLRWSDQGTLQISITKTMCKSFITECSANTPQTTCYKQQIFGIHESHIKLHEPTDWYLGYLTMVPKV